MADDKEADMCGHFTIRGYAAEVRKKDPKICWPFSTHHNRTPSEELMLLPPLSVTRFRQWGCQKCCRDIVSSATTTTANGGHMDTPNDEVKTENCLVLRNSSPLSHNDATKLNSGLSQPCVDAIEGRSNNTNCSTDVCDSENLPSMCGGQKENESAIVVELTKEGLEIYIDENNTFEEKQKQSNDSDCITVEGEKNIFEETTNCLLLQNASPASHHNATKLISGFSQPYIENAIEGRSNDANCSTDICDFEYHPLLCCGKDENESAIATELTTEGLQIFRDENNTSEENQNQSNEFDYIAVEGENNGTEEIGEENTMVTAKPYEISHGEVDPYMVSPEVNEIKSNCGIGSSELCGNLTSKSTNVVSFGLGYDQGVSRMGKMEEPYEVLCGGSGMTVAAYMSDHHSISLADNREASESDIITGNIIDRNQNNANKQEKLSEKMKHRKVRKVRLLNDIMRHEDLCMTGKVHIFEVDVKNNENADEKMAGKPKREAQNPEHGRKFVDQKTEVYLSNRKIRNNAIKSADTHHFPMQWPKKIPTKISLTRKGDIETKMNDYPIGISKPGVNSATGKYLSHKMDVHKVRKHKREAIVGKKKHMLPQMNAGRARLSLQQDSGTGKGYAHKYLPNDHNQKKSVHSSRSITVNEKILHHELKVQDTTHQKDIFSNKKRKTHLVDDENFSQMHLPKGKVTKKRRTMLTCGKGSFDDIPMDIVELLAKKLHEKRMMNADHASRSMGNLSQVTDNLRDDDVIGATEYHGKKGPQFVHNKLGQQEMHASIVRNGVCATARNHENAYYLPKAYRSLTIDDQDNDNFPNQQEMGKPSTSFCPFSHINIFPMGGEVLPVAGQYENSFQMISDRNYGREVHDASGVLLSEGTHGINGPKINPNLNLVNMDSNNTPLKRDPNTSIHNTSWKRSSNPTAKQPLAHEWKDESSIHRETPAATTSVLQIGNRCHSKTTRPADQYPSGNIWAMNFPAVWSDGYFHTSSNINPARFVQESEMYFKDDQTGLLGSGVCVKSIETVEHHGNSCKPVRPVPRIGTLGPILQKEIVNRSGNFRPQHVIKEGCSPNISAISRAEYSKWIVPDVVSTTDPECSRTSKDGWDQPLSSSVGMEICVVNRNPADFTLPDEKSVYMRGKGLRTKYPFSKSHKRQAASEKPKQQKVKKFSALKRLMIV